MKIDCLQKHEAELEAQVDDLLEKNKELDKQIKSLQHDVGFSLGKSDAKLTKPLDLQQG